MKVARFEITNELLCQLLHLPPITEIRGACMGDSGRSVCITVEHYDLADVQLAELERPPLCRPQWTRHEPITFDGWGQ